MSFGRQYFQVYLLSTVELENTAASEWPNSCFKLKRGYFTGLAIFRPVAPCIPMSGLVKGLVSVLFAF